MKTVNFKSFAKDVIQENELNYLKGGVNGAGDPIEDLIVPTRK